MKFDVYSLDMWSDGDGGWTQNNQMKVGTLETSDAPDEKEMLTAMMKQGYLKTDDRRRLYIDDYFDWEGMFTICAKKRQEPLYRIIELV